ncbi:hypothetical protein N9H39_00005, partial [Gammaproteobacteria bacterium]|nr:hypothetical protein [Gammaproteobacteria bacterium]
PYHSVQSDAARLSSKWEKTGLLEGIKGAHKTNMGIILENQAKQLVVESSQSGGGVAGASFATGTGEQWAGVALPLVRKVFGQIAAQEFVSVQPMNLPSGLVFYLDFQYGSSKSGQIEDKSLYGNTSSFASNGTEGGLYGAGRFGYSINEVTKTGATVTEASASWSDLNFDSEYSASVISGTSLYQTITVADTELLNLDKEGVRAFQLKDGTNDVQISAFTKRNAADTATVFVALLADVTGATLDVAYQLQTKDNARGDFEEGNAALTPKAAAISIPEINVQMKSSAIVAKTRKLKAVWTPEFAQDLNAYHALDAEAELTSILSEYISLEIDLEILDMLIENASAGSEVWSAVNNRSIVDNGAGGDINNSLGFFNSQGQWFQTLGTKIQKLSNVIHQKTLRGGANFMVLSPAVSTIIESIPGFAGDVDGDVEKSNYAFGVQKMGALGGGKIKVYKNPYMTENQILLGFRGTQFLESGAVFAPYIPLIMTPLVYDPDTFTPRKGLLTRYAKKMVRPEFYGTIKVEGLNTI